MSDAGSGVAAGMARERREEGDRTTQGLLNLQRYGISVMADGEITPYGMRWGQAEIVRAAEFKGHLVFQICTAKQWLSIRVTPSGIIRIDEPPHCVPGKREVGK